MQKNEAKILGIICAFTFILVMSTAGKWGQNSLSRPPDVIISRTENKNSELWVIAGKMWIKDKEKLADTVFRMYRENAFDSVKFSLDENGFPERLKIHVYLDKEQINSGNPVCRIEFRSAGIWENRAEKEEKEKYVLYIDGHLVGESLT